MQTNFTASGRLILKDGQPFTIKGVCYNPTPIGGSGSQAPHADYFTSEYSALWARDLDRIRDLGANVLRVYGWAPTADHSAFLNACYNGGNRPLYVLANYWIDPSTNWTSTKAVNAVSSSYCNIEKRLGASPAVLGIIVGNEVNAQNGNGTNPYFWSAMNTVAGAIKRLNPNRLVSMAITDAVGQVGSYNGKMTSLDFWCMQIYRGTTFGYFFSDYAAVSGKPLVISEYGFDSFDHANNQPYPDNAAYQATVLSGLWNEIANHASVCSGGCLFEYCDEWFRAPGGSDSTEDAGGWASGSMPDGAYDEEYFGINSIAPGSPNVLTPKAAYYSLQALWAPQGSSPQIQIGNPGFESPPIGTGPSAYVYNPSTGTGGWTFTGWSGVAGNGSDFTVGNPPAPSGTQVAFIQGNSSVAWQTITFPKNGNYRVSFLAAQRGNWNQSRQYVDLYLDDARIGQISPSSPNYEGMSVDFSSPEGNHAISFVGTTPDDSTVFIDNVSVEIK